MEGEEEGEEGGLILSFHSFLTSFLLLYSCEDSAKRPGNLCVSASL
jgi:hypothetical protein